MSPRVQTSRTKAFEGRSKRLGQSRIAVHIRMNNGSAFLQGRNRIEDCRKLLVINVNELKRLFGLFKCIRRHRRYALTHEPDTILRQHAEMSR